jgi:hypothetical protein
MKTLLPAFLKLEKKLAAKWGDFQLFALMLREDSAGFWDLVVAAPWAAVDKRKAIKRISAGLNHELRIDDIVKLSHVAIVKESDPDVVALNREFPTEHAVVELRDLEFRGSSIRHAFILTSRPRIVRRARARRLSSHTGRSAEG